MAWTPFTNVSCANHGVAMLTFKNNLVSCGWVVKDSGDGQNAAGAAQIYGSGTDVLTNGTYDGTTVYFANCILNRRAWFRIQAPGGVRELLVQRAPTNVGADGFIARYSALAKFVTGTPNANTAPTATDEFYFLGINATDSRPFWGSTAAQRLDMMVGDASEGYAFYAMSHVVGSSDWTGGMWMDRLTDTESDDEDPTLLFSVTASGNFTQGGRIMRGDTIWTPTGGNNRVWGWQKHINHDRESKAASHFIPFPAAISTDEIISGMNPYDGNLDIFGPIYFCSTNKPETGNEAFGAPLGRIKGQSRLIKYVASPSVNTMDTALSKSVVCQGQGRYWFIWDGTTTPTDLAAASTERTTNAVRPYMTPTYYGPYKEQPSLSALTISSGTLSPSFSSTTYDYAVSVTEATTSVTVTPTTTSFGATIKVNGVTVTSGSASGAITLEHGTNAVVIVVTRIDGTRQVYSIVVTRPANTLPILTALSMSSGTLSPSFSSGTFVYTAAVIEAITSLTITPTTSEGTITVNGVTVASGSASGSITLDHGANPINIVITDAEGARQSYTITVSRPPNTAPLLSNLTISSGTLEFDSWDYFMSMFVTSTTASVTVTPTASETGATITVNGVTVASGSPSGSIALGFGGNAIHIVVTDAEGARQSYALVVIRETLSQPYLTDLVITGLELDPPFDETTHIYTVNVDPEMTSVVITPTTGTVSNTITVDGDIVASGEDSDPIGLSSGVTLVPIVITGTDGGEQTYTLVLSKIGGLADETAPTIGNFNPISGTPIKRHDAITFDVTDESGIGLVFITVVYDSGAQEVVWDGASFAYLFRVSTRGIIPNGFRYTVRRLGGWPDSPTFKAVAVDTVGNVK